MKSKIKIDNKWVGDGEKAFIIAEAGSNHNKKYEQAKALIDVAADACADAVKFQLYKTENLYTKSNSLFAIFKENELPYEWVPELMKYAKQKGLIFLASPFDKDSVDQLDKAGATAFKLASSEAVNLSLLRYTALKGKPMLISTAMCNLADVYEAVEVVFAAGNQSIVLLHCIALYPTKPQFVNLRVIDTLKSSFYLPVGFSDHTLGIAVPVAAVARGACIIEKHFTLSRRLKGPDHSYALEPKELKQMIAHIREVEQSLGSPVKKMLPEEEKTARRESIYARIEIPKGSPIKGEMILIQRPAFGIKPRFLNAVIGRMAKMRIKKNDPITWESVDQ